MIMRKKKKVLSCAVLFLSIFLLLSCASKESAIDFGTEVINENVEIPENGWQKENLIACYEADGKTVYTLGTRHEYHFLEEVGYSIQDIQSVIENINPDYIFIECREENYDKYQALDGPYEMLYLYAYGKEHNIQVELVDDWNISDNIIEQQGKTSDERDNEIFYNIYDKMSDVKKGETVLICYGSAHFFYQQPRMEMAGWEKIELQDTSKYFVSASDEFNYPECLPEVIQNTIDAYYKKGLLEEAKENVTDAEVMAWCEELAETYAKSYSAFKSTVENNQLYVTQ